MVNKTGSANADANSMLNLNELVGALMQEEALRSSQRGSSHKSQSQVLYAGKPSNRNFKRGPRPPGNRAKSVGDSTLPRKRAGNCNWCGLPNHWERECRKKKAGEPRKNLPPSPEVNFVKKGKASSSVLLMLATFQKNEHEHRYPQLCTAYHNTEDVDSTGWYIDSGATSHICCDKECFTTYERIVNQQVILGDNRTLKIRGEGTVVLISQDGARLQLLGVVHVEEITKNLVSVTQLLQQTGTQVMFAGKECHIVQDHKIFKAFLTNDLFQL